MPDMSRRGGTIRLPKRARATTIPPVEQDWAAVGERVIALTQRLLAVPSVHGTAGEARAIGLLADHLRTGLADALASGRAELQVVDVDRPARDGSGPAKALLAWLAPPDGVTTDTALGLMGHVDTVESGPESSVQSPPSWASETDAASLPSTLDLGPWTGSVGAAPST